MSSSSVFRIFKFGGASVKDAESVKNLASIVQDESGNPLIIVVSAMDKTTNLLEEMASLAWIGEDYKGLLEQLISFHSSIAKDLSGSVSPEVLELFMSLRTALQNTDSDREVFDDAILSHGELLSTRITHDYLKSQMTITWIDAREYITANRTYGDSNVNWVSTEENIRKLSVGGTYITQGFIAGTSEGETITLGREGSDFTAAIFGHSLGAKDVTFWKNVSGILNADPEYQNNTQQFDELSYREITEMAYYGAKVIHHKTIGPLARKGIPLIIRSFLDLSAPFTTITAEETDVQEIPCYIYRFDQLLVTLRTKDDHFVNEKLLSEIFSTLHELNININLMQNTALTFSFCFDRNEEQLQIIRKRLSDGFYITFNDQLELMTVKNYQEEQLEALNDIGEIILQQQSRVNLRLLYRSERGTNHPV